MEPLESDWKTFRRLVPEWRDRYLATKNTEILGLLTASEKSPTERFWDAKERMDKEERILNGCLNNHSRSNMIQHFFSMYSFELIVKDDLVHFSEQLRELVRSSTEK